MLSSLHKICNPFFTMMASPSFTEPPSDESLIFLHVALAYRREASYVALHKTPDKEAIMADKIKYEIPTEMRDFAEKSVDQARKAFDGFLSAAHKAVDTVQGSTTTLQSSTSDATKKTLSYAEQNVAAAFDHAQKLVRAADLQEAMQLQTEYARSQFAAMQAQMKEIGELAQSAARTATNQAASVASEAAAATKSAADQASAAFSKATKAATTKPRA